MLLPGDLLAEQERHWARFTAKTGPCAFASSIDIRRDRAPQLFRTMNMFGNLLAAACPVLVALSLNGQAT